MREDGAKLRMKCSGEGIKGERKRANESVYRSSVNKDGVNVKEAKQTEVKILEEN